MFMSHSIYPSVWMTHPLQILQAQILRSGLTQPGRRAPVAQSQSVSFGGSINPPTTVTPTAPVTPAPAPAASVPAAAAEGQATDKSSKKT